MIRGEILSPMTFDDAVHFLQRMGNIFIDGLEANQSYYCKAHKKVHPYGFWSPIAGIYNGFDQEADVVAWAERLYPNSMDGLLDR